MYGLAWTHEEPVAKRSCPDCQEDFRLHRLHPGSDRPVARDGKMVEEKLEKRETTAPPEKEHACEKTLLLECKVALSSQ